MKNLYLPLAKICNDITAFVSPWQFEAIIEYVPV